MNQIPASTARNICPKDQTLDSWSSRVLDVQWSIRSPPLAESCAITGPPGTGGRVPACLGLGLLHSCIRLKYARDVVRRSELFGQSPPAYSSP